MVAYTSYKLDVLTVSNQKAIEVNNKLIIEQTQAITTYISKTWLKADTTKELLSQIKQLDITKQVEVSYLVIIAVYIAFELLVLIFIKELNKQLEFEQKPIKGRLKQVKRIHPKAKPKIIEAEINEETPKTLKFVGSYLDYAKANNISRSEAKKLFNSWKQQNLLITKDRKKYLKIV